MKIKFFARTFQIIAVLMIIAISTTIVAAQKISNQPLAPTANVLGNLPSNDGLTSTISQAGAATAIGFTTGATPYSLTSVDLRLFRAAGDSGTGVKVELRSNNAGDPSNTVLVNFNNPALLSVGNATYNLTPTTSVILAANTTYWLVVSNTNNVDGFGWNMSNPSATPTSAANATPIGVRAGAGTAGGPWFDFTANGYNSFQINGNVTTAASVSVSGRVFTTSGRPLRNATMIITDSFGNSHSTRTLAFGNYRFEDLIIGQTYVISISSRRYEYEPRLITVNEELENLDFTPISFNSKLKNP